MNRAKRNGGKSRIPKRVRRILILLIWLLLWQLLATLIHNRILFVGPAEAFAALWRQLPTSEFWRTVWHSSLRICSGYLLAFFLGVLSGILAYKKWYVEEFLEPAVALLQSVPVASFVILALIWIGSKNLAVLISFVIVFPVIYRNTLQGMKEADAQLLEMADVFGMSAWSRFWYVYRPSLFPYLLAGSRTACGMAWKSGVAAEVIGVPDLSIGEKLYMAKIYLSTAELFAWTFVVIVVSRLLERAFLWVMGQFSVERMKAGREKDVNRVESRTDGEANLIVHERLLVTPKKTGTVLYKQLSAMGIAGKRRTTMKKRVAAVDRNRWTTMKKCPEVGTDGSWAAASVQVQSLSKSYGEKQVLSDLSLSLEAGQIYCLMGTSGIGKTTLLRILLGLEMPDAAAEGVRLETSDVAVGNVDLTMFAAGNVKLYPESAISAVFQENRLLGYADAVENIVVAGKRRGLCCAPQEVLQNLLEPEAWQKRTELLSGGMQRRVAIARALAVRSNLILMDEPFTGLDEETRRRTIQQILKFRAGRTLLVVTHQEEDAQLLGAQVLRITSAAARKEAQD